LLPCAGWSLVVVVVVVVVVVAVVVAAVVIVVQSRFSDMHACAKNANSVTRSQSYDREYDGSTVKIYEATSIAFENKNTTLKKRTSLIQLQRQRCIWLQRFSKRRKYFNFLAALHTYVGNSWRCRYITIVGLEPEADSKFSTTTL
jgi:hypothetical protein